MISHAFSLSALKAYEARIDHQIARFMNVCYEHASTGKVLNLSSWSYYCMSGLQPSHTRLNSTLYL
jgi:hypothetical protein